MAARVIGPVIDVEAHKFFSGAHRPPVCTMKQVLKRYSGGSGAVTRRPQLATRWLAGWLAGCIAYGYSYTTVRRFPLINRRDDSGQS